ncbi:hypothetical protein NA57DRAFT_63113 [Rhizodiscina lignyota]|uniref:TPR domain protein n=1 Tax=Rhizodiscina lignyota TaxID=1504668 RepID=A0A9P4MB49_9PEZI|nr:hypothetical protein NA57DRAFT_63113 [Rhizodiscina lignyota]
MSGETNEADDYYDLGSYQREVTTTSHDARKWFNRGLIWNYGFNHEESAACFEKAITEDAECAMAHWGLAYTLGPNYNKPWDFFDEKDLSITLERARSACEKAKEHAAKATLAEQALIGALQARYPRQEENKEPSDWNQSYADAMAPVYARFSTDLDVATLYADALMNLTPWQLWDINTGKPNSNARTLEARTILERAMDENPHHPGALHLYIHLMEMSPTPELALPAANGLRKLVPDAGHLNHMPTHIDVLVGDYSSAIESNSDAIRADEKYLSRAGAVKFYTLYRAHDYHFRIYAALFAGQSHVALDTVAELEASMPEELLRVESPPMADWLEGFLAMRVHALVRFGMWRDIIDLVLPSDAELYCSTTAMIHYAKGIAFASTGDVSNAEEQQRLFKEALARVPESRTLFNNKCVDILRVAAAMLDGEISYRRSDFSVAFAHLREAIAREDGLPYDEPWGWMQPARHAYGALLLEQGHVEDAMKVYTADLGITEELPRQMRHPNNVWSAHGYHECLLRLGRTNEARMSEAQLKKGMAVADVEIKSSCFCRLNTN